MQQDRLIQLLKFLYRNAMTVLIAAGFLVVMIAAIFFWNSSEKLNSPAVVTEEVVTQATPDVQTLSPDTSDEDVVSVQEQSKPQEYTVQSGDSLWSIAAKQLGSGERYTALADANNLKHTAWLEVGQKLSIPADSPVVVERDTILFGAEEYVVQPGDSLWKIAQQQLSDPYRWTELYQENKQKIGSNPDLIYPGTILVVPATGAQSAPN